MSLNRFSYVHYNPLRYTDPTGHCLDEGEGCIINNYHKSLRQIIIEYMGQYNVIFNKDKNGDIVRITQKWATKELYSVMKGVVAVGKALANHMLGISSGSEAFKLVYGYVNFQRVRYNNILGGRGWNYGSHNIQFDDFFTANEINERLVVHELGHEFNKAFCRTGTCPDGPYGAGSPYHDLSQQYGLSRKKGSYKDSESTFYGFAGEKNDWQFAGTDQTHFPGENFADSFLGWTYNTWEPGESGLGARRSNYMNTQMNIYLGLYVESDDRTDWMQ
jgi:hypothetical protein